MSLRHRRCSAPVTVLLGALVLLSGCHGSDTDAAGATSSAPAIAPAAMDGNRFCSLLTGSDLAPLVTSTPNYGPTPTMNDGLAGCEWAVTDGPRFFRETLSIEMQQRVGQLSGVRVASTSADIYRTSGSDGRNMCTAEAVSARMPAGYDIDVRYLGEAKTEPGVDPCMPVVPIVTTVINRLHW